MAVSWSGGTSVRTVIQDSRSVSSASSRCSNWSSSASLKLARWASAKRPMIRSASRVPRCHDRNSILRRRGSRPSLEIVLPVMPSPTPKTRRGPGVGFYIVACRSNVSGNARMNASILRVARGTASATNGGPIAATDERHLGLETPLLRPLPSPVANIIFARYTKKRDNVTRQNSRGSHGSRTVRFHACGNVSLAEGRGAFDKNEPYVCERERGVGRQHGFVQWLFGSRLALVVARAGLVRQATSTVLCDLRGGRRRIRRLVDKQASSLDS